MYRGSIPKGSAVTAELQVSGSAGGAALLALAFADSGGGNGSDARTVAPGGTATCKVQTRPGVRGLLRLLVDFNTGTDSGQLTVRVNGEVHDTEAIIGDTPWSYTLS
jgi:hypothetical protein